MARRRPLLTCGVLTTLLLGLLWSHDALQAAPAARTSPASRRAAARKAAPVVGPRRPAQRKATAQRTRPSTKALQARLRKLSQGFFQKGKYPGMSVGVVLGQKLFWSHHLGFADVSKKRSPTNTTLYRVGSITKVFTTTMLAMLRDAGKLRLDDPASSYLPKSAKLPTDPKGAPAITLRHLATHTSGLASLPPNLSPAPGDPYNSYSPKQLYQGLRQMDLDMPTGASYSYSNLGMTLLGLALARRMKTTYAKLARKMLLGPLRMTGAAFGTNLTKAHRKRLAVGYGPKLPHLPMRSWRLGVFQPAGGLVASLSDMVRWLKLQHRAGTAAKAIVRGSTLHELHTPQRLLPQRKPGAFPGGVGLGWHVLPLKKQLGRAVFHNGGVAGFRSFVGFSPAHKAGVIVLTNTFRSADALGFQLIELLASSLPKANANQPSQRLKDMLKQLCSYIVARPPAKKVTALFSPLFLRHLPAANIIQMLGRIHSQMGTCKAIKWHPSRRPRVGFATLSFSKGQQLNALVGLSPSRNGKLMMLQLKPATTPRRR